MAKDIKAEEYITGSEVVNKIERIGSLATLGNWAKEMERMGHKFQHDGRGRRIYSDEDMKLLQQMNDLLGDRHTLKQAVDVTLGITDKEAAEKDKKAADGDKTPAVLDEKMLQAQNKDLSEIKEMLAQLVKQNQQYHEENVQLQAQVTELTEMTKKNEQLLQEPPKKKSWWQRHFGSSNED
ncbi:MerR family transcriptional regulator [Pediococcus siamensis]|uniref:MerR family transcriptional regulator n=1 Tax=Pediococcus siamensis TaxID=381829 RepID=UPI0039A18246